MEVITVHIPYSRGQKFHIYPIGDIHKGSIHCEEHAIENKIQEIRQTPNSYVIGMGDYADCIRKDDKRFDIVGHPDWVKKDNIIESQRQEVVKLFRPVQKQILCLLTGNHEETIHLRDQDNIAKNICSDLGVKYAGYSCYLVLTFDRKSSSESHSVIVHAWHGAGAAQTEGARLMRLMRLVNEFEAHIYLMGHLHAMTQHTPDRITLNPANGRLSSIKLAATITGSWLTAYTQSHEDHEIAPSYAEMKGYKPSRIGCPIIHINPETREFTIES